MNRRRFLQVTSLGALGLLVVGCTEEAEASIEIEKEYFYSPAALNIQRGTKVAWKNLSPDVHTVTCDPAKAENSANALLPVGVGAFDSGDILSGKIWSHVFEQPGEYIYFCRYFEAQGMIGSIRVT